MIDELVVGTRELREARDSALQRAEKAEGELEQANKRAGDYASQWHDKNAELSSLKERLRGLRRWRIGHAGNMEMHSDGRYIALSRLLEELDRPALVSPPITRDMLDPSRRLDVLRNEIISEPGAAIKLTKINLTEEEKQRLNVGKAKIPPSSTPPAPATKPPAPVGFKKGDVVELVVPEAATWLTMGKRYEVLTADPYAVEVMTDASGPCAYPPEIFKLAPSEPDPQTRDRLMYEAKQCEYAIDEWLVEAINRDGDGEVYFTRFSGPRARERAEEYAAFKNISSPPKVAEKEVPYEKCILDTPEQIAERMVRLLPSTDGEQATLWYRDGRTNPTMLLPGGARSVDYYRDIIADLIRAERTHFQSKLDRAREALTQIAYNAEKKSGWYSAETARAALKDLEVSQ